MSTRSLSVSGLDVVLSGLIAVEVEEADRVPCRLGPLIASCRSLLSLMSLRVLFMLPSRPGLAGPACRCWLCVEGAWFEADKPDRGASA